MCLTVGILSLSVGLHEIQANNTYQCEGKFRAGYEGSKAVDGDWMTSAVPDAYNDTMAVIENHAVPLGASAAKWRFKVLRNTADIEIKAYYWNHVTSAWSLLYEVPESLDYTTYTVDVPDSGLLSSPLRTRMWVKNAGAMSGEYFEGVVDWMYGEPGYACEGVFRADHECWRAIDGDWMTSAVPDAYNDTVALIEDHAIPIGVSAAKWRFKVLRNTTDIEIKAHYWNYVTSAWSLMYEVPESLDYTTYTVNVPDSGLLSSPLRTRMWVKNAGAMSGEYFEGVVDWVYSSPIYSCEGTFRPGYECPKAADGDWMTSAVPDAYGDSIAVIEEHPIPLGVGSAAWNFKVLRNTTGIEIRAYYWDYVTSQWTEFFNVPESLDYVTYTVPVPANGLLSSLFRTKMQVKNATFPLMSGEYFEGAVDWIYAEPSFACEGSFRAGYECSNAVDGNWMTSAVPDAYNDTVAVIEEYLVPFGTCRATWQFKVLRNTTEIEIKAYYWNYETSVWSLLYEVPESLDYMIYTVNVPDSGLVSTPLRTRMWVKNAGAMSGDYFEGVVDWSYDGDADGLDDPCDNCPHVPNPNQLITVALTGDINLSGTYTSADVILLVNYVFKGGAAPVPCAANGDINCSGSVTSADIIVLVNHVFKGGPRPCNICTATGLGWSCP